MSTFDPRNYEFSFYTEVSGNFTVPARCSELHIIASGGGGGGGGGGGARSAPTNQPGGATGGTNGAPGGDTIITGSLDSVTIAGGAGGAAGTGRQPTAGHGPGGNGQGGGHSGIQGTALPGQNQVTGSSFLPNSPGTGRAFKVLGYSQNLNSHNPYSVISRDTTVLGGGTLLSEVREAYSYYRQDDNDAGFAVTSNIGVSGVPGQPNPSPSPGTPTNSGNHHGGSGGGGGMAYGVRRKMSVEPNEVLSLTVGSGGNGGNGGNGRVRNSNPAPFHPRAYDGQFGVGGAGGFIHLFWNED